MVNVKTINFTDIAKDKSLRLSWAFAGQIQQKYVGISYPLGFFLSKEKYLLGKIDLYEAESNGRFPLIDQGVSDIAGYTDDEELVYQGPLPAIIFGDHTRIFKYVDFPFVQGADGIKVLLPDNNKVLPKFFYYLLKNIGVPSRGYNRHFTILQNQKYPLFSLEQQKSVLNEIEKIEKEIKQLKSKFSSPRDIIDEVFAEEFDINFEFLLSKHGIEGFIANFYDFQKSNELRFSVKHIYFSKILSQIHIPLIKFRNYFTEQPRYGAAEPAIDGMSNHDIRYIRITDIDDIGNLLDDEWKTASISNDSYILKNGDFLFARSGTVGRSFLYNEKKHGKAIFAGYFIRFRFDHKKLNPLFLLYYSKSVIFNIWKSSIIRVMGQPNINAEEYRNLLIPDISLVRQDQIVSKIKIQLEAQEAKRAGIKQKRAEIEQIIEKVLENSTPPYSN